MLGKECEGSRRRAPLSGPLSMRLSLLPTYDAKAERLALPTHRFHLRPKQLEQDPTCLSGATDVTHHSSSSRPTNAGPSTAIFCRSACRLSPLTAFLFTQTRIMCRGFFASDAQLLRVARLFFLAAACTPPAPTFPSLAASQSLLQKQS